MRKWGILEQIENKELFKEMFEELKESKQILIELLKKILKLQIKDIFTSAMGTSF